MKCKCGHKEEDHHWPKGECEYYGFNESGGMMPAPMDEEGKEPWILHCYAYKEEQTT